VTITLRPYQLDAMAAIEDAWERGLQRLAVQMPTGVGKTVVFAGAIERRGPRALVLAHRDELINQAAEKIRLVAPGLRIAVVHGSQAIEERRETLRCFSRGEVQVLANCAVLTEGYDEPSVDLILIARPTKSRPLYVQMVGRGTRLYPGKPDLLVIDLVGSTTQHKLMTTATLFGVEPGKLREKGVIEATGEKEKADQAALDLQGTLVSKTVDLFRQRDVHWRVGKDVFTLSTGDGMVVVSQQQDGWMVDRLEERALVTLNRGLDLGYAQGIAEDLARVAPGWLNKPDAAWMKRRPSEKMLAALQGWRIPAEDVATAGEASELLSTAIAKAALKRRGRV
jgi:hypothetical protein